LQHSAHETSPRCLYDVGGPFKVVIDLAKTSNLLDAVDHHLAYTLRDLETLL